MKFLSVLILIVGGTAFGGEQTIKPTAKKKIESTEISFDQYSFDDFLKNKDETIVVRKGFDGISSKRISYSFDTNDFNYETVLSEPNPFRQLDESQSTFLRAQEGHNSSSGF